MARGVLVGLDVEDSTRRTKSSPTKLAKKKFSDREYAVLEGTHSAIGLCVSLTDSSPPDAQGDIPRIPALALEGMLFKQE